MPSQCYAGGQHISSFITYLTGLQLSSSASVSPSFPSCMHTPATRQLAHCICKLRAIEVYVKLFSWKFDLQSPPRNANNVEPYSSIMLFSRKFDTPHPHLHYVTREWPLVLPTHNNSFNSHSFFSIPILIKSFNFNFGFNSMNLSKIVMSLYGRASVRYNNLYSFAAGRYLNI